MSEWIRCEIASGLQALLALRLKNAPAADMIQLTADIWVQAVEQRIGRHAIEQVDAPRLQAAFREAFPRLREWPAPADIIERMPPRPRRAALPEPPLSAEQHRENVARAKALLAGLYRSWENNPEKSDKPKKPATPKGEN